MMDVAVELALSAFAFFLYASTWSVVIAALILLAIPVIGRQRAGRLSARAVTFIALLHAFSVPANAIMMITCRKRMYVLEDPLFDFLPYMPVPDGRLMSGYTESSYLVIWIALAIPVWLATIIVWRRIFRRDNG